tara:strand:- start:1384 stop:1563 length:180 start_codon:yes stop_codon:yes gene_type:complete
MPSSSSAGDYVKISNRSGVATCIVARNSEKIQGAAADLTLDKLNSRESDIVIKRRFLYY